MIRSIGLGGGCHWCTEAVFQSLKGVKKVDQGYIAAEEPYHSWSEGIVVHYEDTLVSLHLLIDVHLHTHKSTSNHSRRSAYRSAIYAMDVESGEMAQKILNELQAKFEKPLITKVLQYSKFKASREEMQNYYRKNPDKPFCERYIQPKLDTVSNTFKSQVKHP